MRMTVPTPLGEVDVMIYDVNVPGLVAHQGVGSDAGIWSLTHRASGGRVAAGRTFDEVAKLAAEFGALGDWTRTGEEIYADRAMCAAAVVIRNRNGLCRSNGETVRDKTPARWKARLQ